MLKIDKCTAEETKLNDKLKIDPEYALPDVNLNYYLLKFQINLLF